MSIKITDLYYRHNNQQDFFALKNINIHIEDGEFAGLIGPTGSGKSTLLDQIIRVKKPTSGEIVINHCNIYKKGYPIDRLRQEVGILFQHSEHQLFAESVYEDIIFGIQNKKMLDKNQKKSMVYQILDLLSLDKSILGKSPFELSGGEMRLVAMAGVLIMKPKILLLDEPTAGLDPLSRKRIQNVILHLNKKENMTILLVTHNMEEIAELTDRVMVMDKGEVVLNGKPEYVFSHIEMLEKLNLRVPQSAYVAYLLRQRGVNIPANAITLSAVKREIITALLGKGGNSV